MIFRGACLSGKTKKIRKVLQKCRKIGLTLGAGKWQCFGKRIQVGLWGALSVFSRSGAVLGGVCEFPL